MVHKYLHTPQSEYELVKRLADAAGKHPDVIYTHAVEMLTMVMKK